VGVAGCPTALPTDAREHVTAITTGSDLTKTSLSVVLGEFEKLLLALAGALDAYKEKVKDNVIDEIGRLSIRLDETHR